MNKEASVAVELAKTLETFVQQQSILIQKLVGVTHEPNSVAVTPPAPLLANEGVGQFDQIADTKQNATEEAFGESWDEESLAQHFGEKIQPKPAYTGKALKEMSLDEIKAWEASQDNSSDLYKIKARVANLARDSGGQLTAQGDILCNTYVHVLKSLYDFADGISDSDTKIRLRQLIKAHENMPGMIISAAGAGVRRK